MAMSSLDALPADPLLGLMALYRADDRAEKVDLGVGIYRNNDGATPIMQAVRAAEAALVHQNDTKAYEGPRGNIGFCDGVMQLVFGSTLASVSDRATNLTTPGGCGALYLGLALAKRAASDTTVWVSGPSWPNHQHIAACLDLPVASYRYRNAAGNAVDVAGMMDDLDAAKAGDLVLIQGACHNPTGMDLTQDAWIALADLARNKGFVLFVDIAYHGLGTGLEEDFAGIRDALVDVPNALLSYSCSKNFGLYRERTGTIIALAETGKSAAALTTHLADIARAAYSMPPAHGAAIVDHILSNPDLRQSWEDELASMRGRIGGIRTSLASALCAATDDADYARIANETGMFSMLPMTPEQAQALADDHAIYLPKSGRINVAGMASSDIDYVARAVAKTNDL